MSNSPKKGVGSPGKGRMTGDGTGGREGGVAAWSLAKLEVKCLDWTGTERGLVGSREGSATKHKAQAALQQQRISTRQTRAIRAWLAWLGAAAEWERILPGAAAPRELLGPGWSSPHLRAPVDRGARGGPGNDPPHPSSSDQAWLDAGGAFLAGRAGQAVDRCDCDCSRGSSGLSHREKDVTRSSLSI